MGFITARKLIARAGKGAATKQIGLYENMTRWAARGVQLIFALLVVGLYGHRVDKDRTAGTSQAAGWVYAVLVSSLSCITCVLYAIPFVPAHRAFAWDLTLAVLWLAVFGTFAAIFLHRDGGEPYDDGVSVRVMKAAVWVDLVNCLLWLATGAYGSFRTCVGRRARGLENRIDSKLGDLESRAMGKVSEKMPPGFTPAHLPREKF
jgi:hypothetical protein